MEQSRYTFSVCYEFPVSFVSNAFDPDTPIFADTVCRLEPERRHRVLIVIDDQVAAAHPLLTADIDAYFRLHAASLDLVAPPYIVRGGEAVKNDLTHTFLLLKRINEVGLDRQSFIVAIGGGAVLDMASFAAAIAHRSIRVIRLPTTVLSQADSGVAVKNGVNLFGKKNFIGTFVPPFAVINDVRFLQSLDRREVVSGLVEAVKVSLLRDPAFFEYLETHIDQIAGGELDSLSFAIRRSAELHLAHICTNGDPFELGSARPLDFGHWAAHKLETMTAHRLRHGEAVAIGMALDLLYSVRRGYLDWSIADRIVTLLERAGLRVWDDAILERDATGGLALIAGLQEFREHLGGELHVTLLHGIGGSFEVTEMDETIIGAAIDDLASRPTARATVAHAADAVGRR